MVRRNNFSKIREKIGRERYISCTNGQDFQADPGKNTGDRLRRLVAKNGQALLRGK